MMKNIIFCLLFFMMFSCHKEYEPNEFVFPCFDYGYPSVTMDCDKDVDFFPCNPLCLDSGLTTIYPQLKDVVIREIQLDSNNRLWLAGDSVYCIENNKITTFPNSVLYATNEYKKGLTVDKNGDVWIANTGQLFKYENENWKEINIKHSINNFSIKEDSIYYLQKNGDLVVVPLSDPSSQNERIILVPSSIKNTYFSFVDKIAAREDGIWIVTFRGVYNYNGKTWSQVMDIFNHDTKVFFTNELIWVINEEVQKIKNGKVEMIQSDLYQQALALTYVDNEDNIWIQQINSIEIVCLDKNGDAKFGMNYAGYKITFPLIIDRKNNKIIGEGYSHKGDGITEVELWF